jgi:hypothetical protein
LLRSFLVVVGLIVLLLSSGSSAAAADAHVSVPNADGKVSSPSGVGIRLLDIPTAAQNDPRARAYIVDNLAPGTTIKRRVQVQNNTDSVQTVYVYADAAHINDGSFIGDNGATANSLTTWMSLDRSQLRMAPRTQANVMVTIAVPGDAAEGEQYATVWAEVRYVADPKTGIINASRAGIRVYLSVGPGNGPPTDFRIGSLTANRDTSGKAQLVATVINIGGRAVDITGTLTLSAGPTGLSAGPFPTDSTTTIAPESAGRITVTMGAKLPEGPWAANLELKSGLVTHNATAHITFPRAGKGATVRPVVAAHVWLPWALGTAAVVIILGAGWFLLRRATRVRFTRRKR